MASQILHAAAMPWARWTAVLPGDGYFATGHLGRRFHEGCNFAACLGPRLSSSARTTTGDLRAGERTDGGSDPSQGHRVRAFRESGWTATTCWRCTEPLGTRPPARDCVPTLIEAVTYRLGPHSTADDAPIPTPRGDPAWKRRDPLERSAGGSTPPAWRTASSSTAWPRSKEFAATMRAGVIGSEPGRSRSCSNGVRGPSADTGPQRDESWGRRGSGSDPKPGAQRAMPEVTMSVPERCPSAVPLRGPERWCWAGRGQAR